MLTERQKEKFRKKGEIYRILCEDINPKISLYRGEIAKLEKELRDTMPRTPKGEKFCKQCEVKSMIYDETIRLGDCSEITVYRCEICDYKISEGPYFS